MAASVALMRVEVRRQQKSRVRSGIEQDRNGNFLDRAPPLMPHVSCQDLTPGRSVGDPKFQGIDQVWQLDSMLPPREPVSAIQTQKIGHPFLGDAHLLPVGPEAVLNCGYLFPHNPSDLWLHF